MIALFAVNARAVPIGSPAPFAGFGVDSGAELFVPSDSVLTFEIVDLLGPAALSQLSFYFAGDPGTLITIFSADDQGPPDQSVAIDFGNGFVFDIDAGVVESTFALSTDAIGFAFSFDLDPGVPGGESLVFSQTALNAGVDGVGFYPSLSVPLSALITLEFDDSAFVVESIQGLTPVPEPSSLLTLCASLLLLGAAARRRGSVRS